MKVPSERDVVSKLLDLKEAFGSGVVFERRCLRIGWRWHLVNLEGWAKPRDLEGAMRAIIEAAEATNQKDDVPEGQLSLDDAPGIGTTGEDRCDTIRSSAMPSGTSLEEQCTLKAGHKKAHRFDGGKL
jgi:hypothetical protein